MIEPTQIGRHQLFKGDCAVVLAQLPDASIDAIVTDPPYGLEFMGQEWDAPWQVSSKSKLFGDRETAMPGFSVTRNPTCRTCGGRLRGAKKCSCDSPNWDESPTNTRLRQMRDFQAWCASWAEQCLRVLKPGGHLLSFGGTRTYHRMASGIEDAGFEIRDQIGWVYGSGFPKSFDVSKAIDKASGVEREDKFGRAIDRRCGPTGNKKCEVCGKWLVSGSPCQCPRPQDAPVSDDAKRWNGWGTALKPAWEPIVVARKPLIGTVVENVLTHGTGAINVDGCRIAWPAEPPKIGTPGWGGPNKTVSAVPLQGGKTAERTEPSLLGRWPANIVHDGSREVRQAFPEAPGALAPVSPDAPSEKTSTVYGKMNRAGEKTRDKRYTNEGGTNFAATPGMRRIDSGSAARFFYCAKATRKERGRMNKHPTVKPVRLMRWLVRLVTPPGGIVCDPFLGSGTTAIACQREGFLCLGIESDAQPDAFDTSVARLTREVARGRQQSLF